MSLHSPKSLDKETPLKNLTVCVWVWSSYLQQGVLLLFITNQLINACSFDSENQEENETGWSSLFVSTIPLCYQCVLIKLMYSSTCSMCNVKIYTGLDLCISSCNLLNKD